MAIHSITATAVRVPVKKVDAFSRARRTHAERTIVQITGTDGVVGLGETRGLSAATIINDRFAPMLIGQSLVDLQPLRDLCLPRIPDFGYPEHLVDLNAFAALDMAWWDLTGRSFLGGHVPHGFGISPTAAPHAGALQSHHR